VARPTRADGCSTTIPAAMPLSHGRHLAAVFWPIAALFDGQNYFAQPVRVGGAENCALGLSWSRRGLLNRSCPSHGASPQMMNRSVPFSRLPSPLIDAPGALSPERPSYDGGVNGWTPLWAVVYQDATPAPDSWSLAGLKTYQAPRSSTETVDTAEGTSSPNFCSYTKVLVYCVHTLRDLPGSRESGPAKVSSTNRREHPLLSPAPWTSPPLTTRRGHCRSMARSRLPSPQP